MSIRVSLAQAVHAGGSPLGFTTDTGDVASRALSARRHTGARCEVDAGFLTVVSTVRNAARPSYSALRQFGPLLEAIDCQGEGEGAEDGKKAE